MTRARATALAERGRWLVPLVLLPLAAGLFIRARYADHAGSPC